jgi:hypothetical protein
MKETVMTLKTWVCGAAVLCSLVVVARVHAFTCDDVANTCTYTATVVEPTKMGSGAALTNYKQTNLKASINGGAFTPPIVKPATSVAGGGTVTQAYTFTTAACAKTTFTLKASGTNISNVEGPDTVPVTVVRDRSLDPLCAPAQPGLTLN